LADYKISAKATAIHISQKIYRSLISHIYQKKGPHYRIRNKTRQSADITGDSTFKPVKLYPEAAVNIAKEGAR